MPLLQLDHLEHQVVCDNQREPLGALELALLDKLLRYPDEVMSREELKSAAPVDVPQFSDRKLDAALRKITKATSALWPAYPLVRFVFPDGYVYTETPPKREEGDE
ncbi:MAG: hypothetical protein AAF499_06935 [Pseudomonadota bacterium]